MRIKLTDQSQLQDYEIPKKLPLFIGEDPNTISKARILKYVHDALHNFIYGHDGLVDPLQEAHMFIRQILKLPEEV